MPLIEIKECFSAFVPLKPFPYRRENPIEKYVSPYAIDESDITNFYDEVSFHARRIPKHNVLIIGVNMNRNCKYQWEYSHYNRYLYLILNSENREAKLWTYTCPSIAKEHIDYIFMNKR